MTAASMKSALAFAEALRAGDGAVELSWGFSGPAGEVDVYGGESPEEIDRGRELARSAEGRVRLAGLDPGRRHYFELVPRNGAAALIVAERTVGAEGASNLRDLGGYGVAGGGRVKWGQVFRSDNLARLTDPGLALVKRLGIRTVIDFRTAAEAEKLPNRFPDSGDVHTLHLPIQHGEFEPTKVFERIQRGDYGWISEDFMLEGYIDNVERHREVWKRFFELLAEPGRRPLLFHCTGGKDRTGVGAALLLLVLGAPVETVIEDYGLSDPLIAEVRHRIYAQIEALGIETAKVAPYFTAPPSRLRALLAYLQRRYGSALGYLEQAVGLEAACFDTLRRDLIQVEM